MTTKRDPNKHLCLCPISYFHQLATEKAPSYPNIPLVNTCPNSPPPPPPTITPTTFSKTLIFLYNQQLGAIKSQMKTVECDTPGKHRLHIQSSMHPTPVPPTPPSLSYEPPRPPNAAYSLCKGGKFNLTVEEERSGKGLREEG